MNKWDIRYRAVEKPDSRPLPFLVRAAQNLTPGRALDLACGTGRHALWLAAQGWQVTAVDYSAVALEMLRATAEQLGVAVEVRLADLETDEFDIAQDTYDLVCNCFYLDRDMFPKIRAGVSAGGVAIVIVPTFDDSPGLKPMNPEYLLRPGELIDFFTGWEILDYRENRLAEILARRPF